MARKLKVFQAQLGFYDTVVAAASQAAALRAWESHRNLFAEGVAKPATDAQAIEAALAQPEVPLRRPVGTDDAFSLKPGTPHLPEADEPSPAKEGKAPKAAPPPSRSAPPPDRSALDAAEARLQTVEAECRREEADLETQESDLAAEEQSLQARRAELDAAAFAASERHRRRRKEAQVAVAQETRLFEEAGKPLKRRSKG